MYTIDNAEIAAALDADSRCFRAILDFGSFMITGDDVGRISINSGSVQDELPCIGDVVSAQAEVIVMGIPDGIKMEGKEFQLYLYCISPTGIVTTPTTHKQLAPASHKLLAKFTHKQISELDLGGLPFLPIPFGKFTVLKCRKGSDYYTMSCSDRLHFADKTYRPGINIPATSNAVAADISVQLGAGSDLAEGEAAYLLDSAGRYLLDSTGKRLMLSTWQFDVTSIPSETTMREMLSYIAAMTGDFVVCDRRGTIVRRWYLEDGRRTLNLSNDGNSDGTNCRITDFNSGESVVALNKLVCWTDSSNYISVGSGREMEFKCPYMDRNRLDQLNRTVQPRAYFPVEMIQQLGDPRIDPWDGWIYDNNGNISTLFMLNMQTVCDGGLMIDISSGGDTETEYGL